MSACHPLSVRWLGGGHGVVMIVEFNPTLPNHVAFVARVHHGTPMVCHDVTCVS